MSAGSDEPQKIRVLEDLNFATDRLSTEVRQISLGLLGLIWALLVGEAKLSIAVDTKPLLVVAALSILAMVIDFIQYIAGYFASRRAWDDIRSGGQGRYQREWWSYRIRTWSFGAKIIVSLGGTALMLGVLARLVIK
jgi:hypothetical protein